MTKSISNTRPTENQLVNFHEEISMTTVEIAMQTGKQQGHVKRDTERVLTELYGNPIPSIFGEVYTAGDGKDYKCYRLPKREILILVSGYSIKLRAAIIDRLEELEKEKMQNKLIVPNFSNPAEAARAWALEYEQKQIALTERDEAVKTKAWISDKKTATAMATASAKVRENEKLKEQIGDSKKYKQVKAIPWLKDYFILKGNVVYGQIGKYLSKLSRMIGIEPKEVDDTKWGKVKAYHVEVIDKMETIISENPGELGKYRKIVG